MKILLGQINPTPCDWVGNLTQIQDGIARAVEQGASLVVFPEACIPGYLCQDAMYSSGFVSHNLRGLQELIEFSRVAGPHKPYIIVGYVDRNHSGCGKPFRNMAAVIRDGQLIGTYQKQLIPYYQEFYEGRYFEPGNTPFVFTLNGVRWGLLICEDWWNDKGQTDFHYAKNPVQQLKDLGVKHFITINASPFQINKHARRFAMAKEIATYDGVFVFVNQRGGMDELVFDGNSFIASKNNLLHVSSGPETPRYDIVEVDVTTTTYNSKTYEPDVVASLYDVLQLGIHDYVRKSGFKEVVVGSSGGIDSALVITACCDALGPDNVHGVRMPTANSSVGSITDAEELHRNLGCHDHLVPVEYHPFLRHINKNALIESPYNDIADQNIQARLRALVLMHLSNAYGWLLMTTGNKTEATFGYCTLGGDMMGGFAPIKDLYKGRVFQLATFASHQRIPQSILTKKPSAELAPNQFDEDDLLPYPILDAIAQAYAEDAITSFEAFRGWLEMHVAPTEHWKREEWKKVGREEFSQQVFDWARQDPREIYDSMIVRIEKNEFKRRLSALGLKFTKAVYGTGRIVPVARKY